MNVYNIFETYHCRHKFTLFPSVYHWRYQLFHKELFRTCIIVTFDTGTNFPAVSVNSLLAAAMMNTRHRWNGTGVPTQSHPQAASLTPSAWNEKKCVSTSFCSWKSKSEGRKQKEKYLFWQLSSKPAIYKHISHHHEVYGESLWHVREISPTLQKWNVHFQLNHC
jgi:hypothetical protein